MGTEAAGREGCTVTHTWVLGLVLGTHLSQGNEWPQLWAAAGDCSSQEGPLQHEIPEDSMAFEQPNALPYTHWASEETLCMFLSPAWGWAPLRQHSLRVKKGPNEWDATRTWEVWLVCINSSIYLCIKIFINHTLQFQQRNSPKMSWFHELN